VRSSGVCVAASDGTASYRVARRGAAVDQVYRMARDINGNPRAGLVGVTFSIYAEESGGSPLWVETQNVQADKNGHYAALLGATKQSH